MESTPTARAKGQKFGPSCRAGFELTGAQGAVTKSGRGSCQIIKVLMKETRTERGVDRQEKILGRLIRRPTAWTTRGGCMSKSSSLYVPIGTKRDELKKAGKTTERRKAPRSSDRGSFRDFRGGRRERLYERQRESQEAPPTDAGPDRKALAALDLNKRLFA